MNKRERIQHTIAGEPTDRPPVACWRHFPGDDQRSADFAHSLIQFQRQFDWDFLVALPANSYLTADYGAFDEWSGAPDGTRTFPKRFIQRSLDWTNLRPLDPARGALNRVLEALRTIGDTLAEETPLLAAVISPLTQAAQLAGDDVLIRHARTQGERLQTGLNTLTETTLRWVDALRRLPNLAGVVYLIRHADYAAFSEDEYAAFGLPYDRKIVDAFPSRFWFNMIHVGESAPMFKFANGFKAHALHWRDRETEVPLSMGKTLIEGAVCGGVSLHEMVMGTPTTIREAVREAQVQMNGRRLIVAAGDVVPLTTPLSNLRALREAVDWKA